MTTVVLPAWLLEVEIEPRAVVLYAHMAALADHPEDATFPADLLAERMRCTDVTVYRYLQALIEVGAVQRVARGAYRLVYVRPEAVA